MTNPKNDAYHLKKVVGDFKFIIEHTEGIEKESFYHNEILIDSIMFRFIQISEHIKKFTDSFLNEHQDIPWKSIIGLRNRIVHDYGNVDFDIIYDTVTNDIHDLLSILEECLIKQN